MSDLKALRKELEAAIAPCGPGSQAWKTITAVFPVVERFVSSLPQDPEDSTTADLARNLAALADALENDANESDSSAFVAYAYQRAAQGIRDLLPVVESCPPVPTKET